MAELKRKVTLKRKTPKESEISQEKAKNKFLWPIVILLLIAVFIGGYFLIRDNSTTNQIADDSFIETTDAISTNKVSTQTENVNPEAENSSKLDSKKDETIESKSDAVDNKTTEPQKEKPELPYKPNETYKIYQFPFGASDYSQPDPELDKLVKVMSENTSVKIQIFAYTDNVGSAEYNQVLSQKRAKAIYDYLISKGINSGRLSYQGKGISAKYSNDAENRRAEFVIK